ncbi:uncharacterized protein KY384_000172 [Bacidia gigantensis]|uniref:uncharacterized protein n=1 Tax=Bacidia gigantensis TaxID=2732470 RepID=UPI001D0512F3|nr:uncharacterized protein KY384_000172 [Bacidia gigantensis]KAG8526179.1 hypothetical protein KY384_000172 [Bacidia gigantensis]
MRATLIQPNSHVALKLPSELYNIVEVRPNTTVHLGKYGHFQSNDILGRPFHLTFELLDKEEGSPAQKHGIRIVPAAEIYADIQDDDSTTPSELDADSMGKLSDGVQYDVVGEDGQVIMRTNRHTTDDPSSQVLTHQEIEALKTSSKGSGKEVIAKILDSHAALDQKTAFALAKYTLRKTKKYLKRFTVLPVDVSLLVKSVSQREPAKILELREDTLALIGSWSNLHYGVSDVRYTAEEPDGPAGNGRWLVVDETSGLVTAYVAEKLGLLLSSEGRNSPHMAASSVGGSVPSTREIIRGQNGEVDDKSAVNGKTLPFEDEESHDPTGEMRSRSSSLPSRTNTITVVHSLHQPNLSLLRYFSFDPHNPPPDHPLNCHLKTLSWLQLTDPAADSACIEPPQAPIEEIKSWKSAKRATYIRKRRRWERVNFIVDETRAGGFDGLIVASVMSPISVLNQLVPLLRGSAQIVVYSPYIEPLAELADCYSSDRKTAFLNNHGEVPSEDFPVDPRLLLAPTIYYSRAKAWQSLPGRTHPLMTGKGGADGFILVATRVIPAEGDVSARGKYNKRRRPGPQESEADSVEAGPTMDVSNGMV